MSDSTFRSRYAGMPGSLVAIRVDYARRSAAFDPSDEKLAVEKREAKRDVKRWKMGQRLGDKPEWNNSAQPEGYVGSAPQRPNLHQLSEFQGVKLDYNYRASKLPDINHSTRYVPKASKLQVDRSVFLSPAERELLVRQNLGTTTALSRREMTNDGMEGAEREGGWNNSTVMDGERSNIYKLRGYDDFREINKTKSVLDHSKYVPPQKRQTMAMKTAREAKLAQREEDARLRQAREAAGGRHPHSAGATASSSSGERVFKMSNIDSWWDDTFDEKMLATASAVLNRPVLGSAGAAAATSAKSAAAAGGADGGNGADTRDP